jgi:aminoglycoside phosphotransferase (APT) family kinase protein
MLVRMPSGEAYAGQVAREQRWLPWLAPQLDVRIPEPVALGKPALGYPYPWSIYRWIEGETLADAPDVDFSRVATDLAKFLVQLHSLDATQGPSAGPENHFRGGALRVYDADARAAIGALPREWNRDELMQIWEEGIASTWTDPPVWVHGDLSAGNVLLTRNELVGVIDFGLMSVGDPACDCAIAWTAFDRHAREGFRAALPLDAQTWARGRAWALWKAAIVTAGHCETNADEAKRARRTLAELVA